MSLGAGQQSTALCLMSVEKKLYGIDYLSVPVYDAVVFSDLGHEPNWVYTQLYFAKKICDKANIPFYILKDKKLYDDYIKLFGESRVVSVPFWSLDDSGKKAKMRRHCTIDYKISNIHKFIKWNILGYKKYQRMKVEDIGKHEMHIGFSAEEANRIFDSYNPLFINKFPLVEMGLTRADNYKYLLETWGIDTKASACNMCPFHRNYFFKYLKENYPDDYEDVVTLDNILEQKQHNTMIHSKVFISRSRKRIVDLSDEDCNDKEIFSYCGNQIWNGF